MEKYQRRGAKRNRNAVHNKEMNHLELMVLMAQRRRFHQMDVFDSIHLITCAT